MRAALPGKLQSEFAKDLAAIEATATPSQLEPLLRMVEHSNSIGAIPPEDAHHLSAVIEADVASVARPAQLAIVEMTGSMPAQARSSMRSMVPSDAHT